VRYRKQLTALTLRLRADATTSIVPLLLQLRPEYTNDGYATTLEQVFDRLRQSYNDITIQAKMVSNSFVTNANQANKQRFYRAMESAIGVNLNTIVQDEGLEDILVATTRENVSLIKSIPDEYFKKIETIVFTGTTQGSNAGSMIKQIRDLGHSTTKRAKLIARDQSSKLNSALSQQRQQNLGVEEYIWVTADDGRVRESHADNDGKRFRWDDPPKKTGHPGNDIQCRCVARPIINI
tara:strand:- start:14966 stop:15676 length:711 start_codon:yes stop_codon:yes gene_type:complete